MTTIWYQTIHIKQSTKLHASRTLRGNRLGSKFYQVATQSIPSLLLQAVNWWKGRLASMLPRREGVATRKMSNYCYKYGYFTTRSSPGVPTPTLISAIFPFLSERPIPKKCQPNQTIWSEPKIFWHWLEASSDIPGYTSLGWRFGSGIAEPKFNHTVQHLG